MNPLLIGKDLADMTITVPASAHVSATAGGAGNNTVVTGTTIDRLTLKPYGAAAAVGNAAPVGAMFEIFYDTSLSSTYTLSLNAVTVEHSPDGSTWSVLYEQGQTGATAPPSNWPAAGVVASATGQGVVTFGCNVQGADRYVRILFTPDLSNTATDTATLAAACTFSGYGEVPAAAV